MYLGKGICIKALTIFTHTYYLSTYCTAKRYLKHMYFSIATVNCLAAFWVGIIVFIQSIWQAEEWI